MARTKNAGQRRAERRALRRHRHAARGDWFGWMDRYHAPTPAAQETIQEPAPAEPQLSPSPSGEQHQATNMSNEKGGLRAAWKKHRAVRRLKEERFQDHLAYNEGRLDWMFTEFAGFLAIVVSIVVALLAQWTADAPKKALIAMLVGGAVLVWPYLRTRKAMRNAQADLEAAGLRRAEPPAKATQAEIEAAKEAAMEDA